MIALEAIADLGFDLSPRSIIKALRETVLDLTGGAVRLRRSEIGSILDASSIEDAIVDFSSLLGARGGVDYAGLRRRGNLMRSSADAAGPP